MKIRESEYLCELLEIGPCVGWMSFQDTQRHGRKTKLWILKNSFWGQEMFFLFSLEFKNE